MWAKCLPVCPFENTDCCMVCLLSHQGDCHAPSWLDLGELSHTRIHLTMDHDSTQLNASPRMGNVEYSLTWTSPTLTDISGQAGMVRCRRDNNPPHESFVESDSRARMSYHNHPKSRLHSIT